MSISNYTEWLFFHLWKKPTSQHSEKKSQTSLGVLIPNTVIFRWAQPLCWYFTAPDGTIRRKKKENLTLMLLEKQLSRQVSKSPIVSMLMYEDPKSQIIMEQEKEEGKKEGFHQREVKMEYLDRGMFGDFLYNRDKPLGCILQSFVEPYQNKNMIIRVRWTPQNAIFQRKTNLNNLLDEKVELKNRLTTIDGPTINCSIGRISLKQRTSSVRV